MISKTYVMLEYTYKFNLNRVKFALVLFLCVSSVVDAAVQPNLLAGFLQSKTSVFAIYVIFAVVVVVLGKNKFP